MNEKTPTSAVSANFGPDTIDETETPTAARIGAFVSEHPFAAAGAAIAAGAVIGLLIPRWRVGASAGSAVFNTAKSAAKAVAAAETVRTVISGLSSATGTVKSSVTSGAKRIADHVPDAETVKATAIHALERAGETAQKAGDKVVSTARRAAAKVQED